MKSFKKMIAVVLSVVMILSCLSVVAFASNGKKATGTKKVKVSTDVKDIKNSSIIALDSNPKTFLATVGMWALEKNGSEDFAEGLYDLVATIPADNAKHLVNGFVVESISSVEAFTKENIAHAKYNDKALKDMYVIGDLYKATGDIGKATVYAVTLGWDTAVGGTLVAFVLTLAGVGIGAVIPVAVVMSPIYFAKNGPQMIEQAIYDITEIKGIFA